MTPVEQLVDTTHHLYPLISDLGLILMTAGVSVLLFKKIRQPLVLGYLVAGFLAGPHFLFFPSVKEIHSVEVWAEIGVIFLLFSLGLEFSFKKLMKVGGTASITAITQIVTISSTIRAPNTIPANFFPLTFNSSKALNIMVVEDMDKIAPRKILSIWDQPIH